MRKIGVGAPARPKQPLDQLASKTWALYARVMGLRLVAHYFDRGEALIVSGALDAAGIPAFVHGLDILTVRPFYEMALGGYRVVVPEEDLGAAVDVIAEARRKPVLEGERLVTRYYLAPAGRRAETLDKA